MVIFCIVAKGGGLVFKTFTEKIKKIKKKKKKNTSNRFKEIFSFNFQIPSNKKDIKKEKTFIHDARIYR